MIEASGRVSSISKSDQSELWWIHFDLVQSFSINCFSVKAVNNFVRVFILYSLFKTLFSLRVFTRDYIWKPDINTYEKSGIFLFSLNVVSHCCRPPCSFVMQRSHRALNNPSDIYVCAFREQTTPVVCLSTWYLIILDSPESFVRCVCVNEVTNTLLPNKLGTFPLQPPTCLMPIILTREDALALSLPPHLPEEANSSWVSVHMCASDFLSLTHVLILMRG